MSEPLKNKKIMYGDLFISHLSSFSARNKLKGFYAEQDVASAVEWLKQFLQFFANKNEAHILDIIDQAFADVVEV
jgi:hypothetical protein